MHHQEYETILKALLTHVNVIPESTAISNLAVASSSETVLARQQTFQERESNSPFVLLQGALERLDKTRARLMLDEPDLISDDLRKAMQSYTGMMWN